jgi:hypothetical protein
MPFAGAACKNTGNTCANLSQASKKKGRHQHPANDGLGFVLLPTET